jgi:RNA polymerase sigma-70 factor (ECF subfamily)
MAAKHSHVRQSEWQPAQGEVAEAARVGEAADAAEVGAAPGPGFDAGDFSALYAAWFGHVLRWIRALGAPAGDQDDLVQEVFIVVHRRLHDFDGRNLAGWLYRIAAHQVRDFRRLRWIKNVFKRSEPLSHRLASPGPTPVVALETREKQELLERLLAQLSEPLRSAFVLFEIDGYTGDEIAALQDVPINTVRARIHRARKKMFELLLAWRDDVEPGRP